MESNVKIIHLEGNSWKAAINCEKFFPCSQAQIRRLYKQYISQATNIDAEEVMEDLASYLKQRCIDLQKETEYFAVAYENQKTKREEMKRQYADKKKSNGVPLTKEGRKELADNIRSMNETCQTLAVDINKRIRQMKRLTDNGILVEELM